jgi:hypothetical protein
METPQPDTNISSEGFIVKSRKDMVMFLALNHWNLVIQAMKEYYYMETRDANQTLVEAALRMQIITLFERLRINLKQELSDTLFKELKDKCYAKEVDTALEGFYEMEEKLMRWGVISMGYKQSFNPEIAGEEDAFYGN